MTPQTIISTARFILNDTDPDTPRQTNDELVSYVNAGMMEISHLRPELFLAIGHIECTPFAVEQALRFSDAQRVLNVIGIHDGAGVTPFDYLAMQAFNPNWRNDDAAPAKQWSPIPNDLLKFYIYPRAPGGQLIDVQYVRYPTVLSLNTSITEIPVTFESALVDYVVYRAESKDDENVLNQRAVLSYQAFIGKVNSATGAPK